MWKTERRSFSRRNGWGKTYYVVFLSLVLIHMIPSLRGELPVAPIQNLTVNICHRNLNFPDRILKEKMYFCTVAVSEV